jgi:drug/metabolite transporter (DMT)-like permease
MTIIKNIKDILYLQLIFVLFSFIGVIAKTASQYDLFSKGFIKCYILELLLIIIYAYFWQKIIKNIKLVVAYSNKGTVIIWNLLWAILFFQENININNIIGSVIIIFGIVLVTSDGI